VRTPLTPLVWLCQCGSRAAIGETYYTKPYAQTAAGGGCLRPAPRSRGVHGNGEDWESHGSHGIPMGMEVRSSMGWEWDGNGNKVRGNGS